MSNGFFNNYFISDKEDIIISKEKVYKNKPKNLKFHYFDKAQNYSLLNNHRFSRIIASYVWEHIENPEENFLNWVKMLDSNGNLSIAIPCDPGFGWRLGQIYKKKDQKKILGLDKKAFDLEISREHINPAHRLIRIANYYFPNCKWSFFPFPFLPIIEFNLVAYIQLSISDFKEV